MCDNSDVMALVYIVMGQCVVLACGIGAILGNQIGNWRK